MSIPLPVPAPHAMNRSHPLPSSSFDLFSRYTFNSGCALTILRGNAEQSIGPHTPIYKKADATASPARPRFASSFAKPTAPKPVETSLNVHAVSDSGILLPFLDRPSEVHELLFQTRMNEALMHRLCRIFGGDIHAPTQRSVDERWDEMLELLNTDRPILDDEDWLIRIESLVMERSPELWAQLSRCLGADGLTCSGPSSSSHSRFDSWAPSRSSQSSVRTASPTDDDEMRDEADLDVNVEALENVPASFSKQPAKMQQSSLHDFVSSPTTSHGEDSPLSPTHASGSVFPMSYGDSSAASLADIMEEPGKGPAQVIRKRSQSGRFAALRISAMSSSSPSSSRRSSDISASRPASAAKDRSVSPMPADTADTHLGSALDATEPAPASFSRHRRLSSIIVNTHTEGEKQAPDSVPASPRTSIAQRLRGPSEADRPASPSSSPAPKAGRRRAQSFARSFAGLNPHQPDVPADNDKAAPKSAITASKPAETGTSDADNSSSALTVKEGRKRRDSESGSSGSSSPILGLLPDGRTRHPSGSCGSKDLSESVAAFRATMGLSTSPSHNAHNLDDDATSNSGAAEIPTRKRKGTGAERPQLSSMTNTAEPRMSADAKVLRVQPPESDVSKPPEHMQKLGTQQKGAGGGSGSGLALGGGFSLAKSGANFRKPSQDASPAVEKFSFHSPPSVRRRPGGFASLANEYDFARRSRRATNESVFSMNSNALGSSPSSSVGSLDFGQEHRRSSSEDSSGRVEEPSSTQADMPSIVATEPTPNATPGAVTPRGSFGDRSPQVTKPQDEYPFPARNTKSTRDASITKLLSPSQSVYLSAPTGPNWQAGPRSPTLVFPISSNPAISRARELQKALSTPACRDALAGVGAVCDAEDVTLIRELIGNTERAHMSDEALLEAVGQKMGLVDHERAHQIGGRDAHHADVVLAEPGYDQRWHAFAALCRALGVGQYEISAAKRRCGPAIDLCGP